MSASKANDKVSAKAAPKKDPTALPLSPLLLQEHRALLDASAGSWKEKKRLPPVLLLTGPAGIGKREIARHLSALFHCERAGFHDAAPAENDSGLFGGGGEGGGSLFGDEPVIQEVSASISDPCWKCAACLRALSGNPIDVHEITPEKDSSTLKIDQFREVKESQGFSGYTGRRIFLIPDAERMTMQAANSLLKILEEPPAGWIFLLTTPDPSLLPSTVVSRCQTMRLKPLSSAAIRALLKEENTPDDRIALATSLSQGSLGRARELASEELWEKRSLILDFLAQPQGALNALVDWAALSDRDFTLLLDQFEQLLFDLLRSLEAGGKHVWANTDAVKTLQDHRTQVLARGDDEARAFWMGRLETLFAIRRYVSTPLNTKLLAQDLLMPFLAI